MLIFSSLLTYANFRFLTALAVGQNFHIYENVFWNICNIFLSPGRYWRRQNRGKLSDGWSSSPTRTSTTTPTPHWPPRPTPTTHTTTKGMVDVWVGGDLSGELSGWARVRNDWLTDWLDRMNCSEWENCNVCVCVFKQKICDCVN